MASETRKKLKKKSKKEKKKLIHLGDIVKDKKNKNLEGMVVALFLDKNSRINGRIFSDGNYFTKPLYSLQPKFAKKRKTIPIYLNDNIKVKKTKLLGFDNQIILGKVLGIRFANEKWIEDFDEWKCHHRSYDPKFAYFEKYYHFSSLNRNKMNDTYNHPKQFIYLIRTGIGKYEVPLSNILLCERHPSNENWKL